MPDPSTSPSPLLAATRPEAQRGSRGVLLEALRLLDRALGKLAILAVRGYQRGISPLLPRCCRFTPSCSQYMIEAVRKKGFAVGVVKGLYRLLRCNPFVPGGYDPVT